MPDALDPLILDLLRSLAGGPRSYGDVMDAWRTSCPRLPVWETAHARGLVARRHAVPGGATVELTDAGRALLARRRGEPVEEPSRPT